jgi:hypothetical protein
MVDSMALAHYQQVEHQPRYTFAELVDIRRQVLRYARSIPPGPDRNEHRQVAVSLGRLFRNGTWRDAHIFNIRSKTLFKSTPGHKGNLLFAITARLVGFYR